ncbi:MAG: hypothetical protein Q8P33_02890, partial [bacterium]|nr:hypothetical protein [bacterium]
AAGSFTLIDLPAVQQKGITAASDTPMSGGSKKEITVLTSEDVDSAKDAVKGELAPALTTEIKSKLTDEEELLDGASQGQVTKASTNKAVGEEADQVEVTVTVEVRALVTRPADVRAAAQAELSDSLPGNQELLNDEEEVVTWTKKAADFEQKRLIVSVQAEKKAAYRIDEAALRAELLGKQEDEAQSYLEGLSEVSSARVKLSPVWRNNLPKKASKVQIEVNR